MPRPSVIFACATVDAPLVARVVPRLVELGTRVEIVDGVDLDTRPLEAAVERHNERSAYVVCQSEELDEYQKDLLVLTIRAGEVPESLVWPTRLEPHDIDGLMGSVLKRLLELGWLAEARQHAKGRRRNVTMRGLAMPAVEPPKKRNTAPTQLYGEELSDAARASDKPRVRKPVVPRVVPAAHTEPKKLIPAPPAIPKGTIEPAPARKPQPVAPKSTAAQRIAAAPKPVEPKRPAVAVVPKAPKPIAPAPAPAPAPVAKPSPAPAPERVAMKTEKAVPEVVVETAPKHKPVSRPPVRSGYTTPSVPILVASRESARTEIAEVARPRRRRWLAGLAAAAAVALTWTALPEDDAASATKTTVSVAANASVEHEDTAADLKPSETSEEPMLVIEDGQAEPAPTRTKPNATDVHGALFTREIRALDALLVADLDIDLRYRDGRAACLSLVRGGEDAWRLPTPDELEALAEAGFLPSEGSWWTGGKDNKKKRAVWNGKRVRQRAASRRIKAKTICVSAV